MGLSVQAENIGFEERSRRMLIVLYAMAGGSTEVAVSKADLARETWRLGVWDMSDEEFSEYHRRVLEEVEVKRLAESL